MTAFEQTATPLVRGADEASTTLYGEDGDVLWVGSAYEVQCYIDAHGLAPYDVEVVTDSDTGHGWH